MNSGLTLHIMSTNQSSSFNNTNLSYGMSKFRQAPGTSNINITRSSNTPRLNWSSNASIDTVGAEDYYCLIYDICALPYANYLPLISPHNFSLIKVIASNASYFCLGVISEVHNITNVVMSCNCLYYLNMASMDLSLN